MSKNIWILNHYTRTPDMVGGTRHYDLAKELIKKDYNVIIFASGFEHKLKKYMKVDKGKLIKTEKYNGVCFVWINTFPYYYNNWRRILNIISYTIRVLSISRKFEKPDVIIGSSPHPFAAFAAAKLARKLKAKFFLEIRDLWPQVIVDMGKLNRYHPIIQVMRLLEKYLYRVADKIIVLAEGSKNYLIENRRIKDSKILYLSNGVDLNNFSCQKDRDILRKLYNFNKFTLIYTGAHGPANSLDTILRAADRLRENKNIEIILVGSGILKERLLRQAKEMKLNNVRFFNPVPKTEIPGILTAADVAIITLKKVKVFSYGVSPNKLFDYMAARKPIICAVEGEIAEKVENIGCGISVIPEDEKSMADAIIHLVNLDQNELKKMGDNGYEEIKKNYSHEKLAKKLIGLIEK